MKKIFLALLLISLSVTLTGCNLFVGYNDSGTGGVFKSFDYGENWQASNFVTTEKRKNITIDETQINVIKIDPQNHTNVYLGTLSRGIWYSDNAGGSWKNILDRGNVIDMALDPQNTGVIYVILGNQVYKSIDLGEKWQAIYLEERPKTQLTSLTIDPNNNLLVYLATSRGDLFKTLDGGESWQLVSKFDSSIQKICIHPKNSNYIYLGSENQAIYRSTNSGQTWVNLKDNVLGGSDRDIRAERKGAELFHDLAFDQGSLNNLLYASEYGLLRSSNNGNTWQPVQILTSPRSVNIRSLVIDPQDSSKIYYTTNTALYRTFDKGQTWLTSSLTSSRIGNYIAIDPQTPNIIYIGMGDEPKKPLQYY